MNEKEEYIYRLGMFLTEHNKTMSFRELAQHLNRNGFTNNYGNPYNEHSLKGMGKVVSSVWHKVVQSNRNIEKAFVGDDNTLPWE